MSDFHNVFLSFYEQFIREKPNLEALGSMNSKGTKKLRESLKSLGTYHALLVRIHYLRHTDAMYELEDLLSQFQNLSPLPLQEAMNCFQRPNDKERFSSLILFFRSNIDLFAQMSYFALLSASHEGDPLALAHDDVLYFCFSTFPSIFRFFMTKEDQDLGINFIISILSFHLYIHGPNFAKPHIFLSYLVSAFFTTANPSSFFEHFLTPCLRDFSGASPEVRYRYTLEIDGALVRSDYWHQLINLADFLITNMIKNADLLPRSVRRLISAILNLNCEYFPFAEIFVIDSMILDYLERSQTLADPTLMHDVCEVIRCAFPADTVNVPLRPALLRQQFLNALNLQKLAKSLALPKQNAAISETDSDPLEIDPLGTASMQFDKTTFITPRSLSILHHFSSLFSKVANPLQNSPLKSFEKYINGLEDLKKKQDNKFFELPLESAGNQIPKTKNAVIIAYDEIVSTMEGMNISNIDFSTPHELVNAIIQLNGLNIPISQQIQLQTLPKMMNGLDGALEALKESINKQKVYANKLFISTQAIEAEKDRIMKQWATEADQTIKVFIVPLLFSKYQFSFNYDVKNPLFGKQLFDNALRSTEMLLPKLGLPNELNGFVKKGVLIEFLDLFNSLTFFQDLPKKIEFKINPSVEGDLYRVNQASRVLELIKPFEKPTYNLAKAIEATRFAKTKDNIINAILRSKNPDIFGFVYYYSAFMTAENVAVNMMSNEDRLYMKLFIDTANEIRKTN